MALGQLFYFIGCNLYRRFGSVFEPIRIFPIAAIVVFLASIPLSFARTTVAVYVTYWIMQLSTGFYWPPVMAWLTAGLNEKEMNREISIYNRSWMGAIILAPLTAGTLYRWNSDANFIVMIACYFMVLVILSLLRRYSKKTGISLYEKHNSAKTSIGTIHTSEVASASGTPLNVSADRTESEKPESAAAVRRDAVPGNKLDFWRYKGWINVFSSSLFLGIFGNIIPLYIRYSMGYTERSAGVMLFIRSICGFLGFTILARFSSWHFNRRWFYFLQAGIISCAVLFLFSGGQLYLFYFIAILVGLINSGCYNNSIFYSSSTGKNPRKNLALHEIVQSVGSAAGSAGGGFIYQNFRYAGTFTVLILFQLLMTGAIFCLDRISAGKN